jgi:two-component system LytT family response regulator
MIRVLIVDDEAPARSRLRQMLAAHPDLEVAGEAETGIQAMQLTKELAPDLLLLDIRLPGCSGIDVAACLPHPRPAVVFCTAFEEHAVDAFELHAVDYLLKPITRVRLAQALDRVRALPAADRESAIDRAVASQRKAPARFLVKSGAHYLVVAEAKVLYFSSDGGFTQLTTDGAQYWMDPSLNEIEERLDPARFFRVSRAAIVSLNAIAEVHPMPGGSGELVLKTGQRIEVSRRRFRELLQALDGLGRVE